MTDAEEYALQRQLALTQAGLQKAMAMLDIAELGVSSMDRDMRPSLLSMTETAGGALFRNRHKECGS